MKKLLVVVLVFVFISVAVAQDIDKILQQRLKEEPVGSSISVAVIDATGIKYYAAGSVSKKADAKAVDKDSVYEIGSITKVFTGILLAEAIKRGEVKQDDPLSKFLPGTIKPLKYKGKEITLFDLTSHGSSLPRMPNNFNPKDGKNPYADYTVDMMFDFLKKVELKREIGSKFDYSNLGVGLLGHILSQRAKMSYEELVKKRILEPLGMKNTAITFSPWMKAHLAIGHGADGKETSNWDIPTFAGAGALRSTANDMAKFVAANLGFNKNEIAESLAEARKVKKTYKTPPMKLGFNWITTKAGKMDIQWHNGGTGGYRSFAGMDHANKRGVFVVTNGSASVDDIGNHILNKEVPLRKIEKPKTEISVSAETLETYVGEYQLSPEFSIVVTREGEKLFAQATKQPRFQLFAEKVDKFFVKVVAASVSFTKDGSGKVTGLILHQGGNNTPGKKVK